MYKYRLTRLGKVVVSVLSCIVLLITYSVCRMSSANAQNGIIIETDEKSGYIEYAGTIYSDNYAQKTMYYKDGDYDINKKTLRFTGNSLNGGLQGDAENKDSPVDNVDNKENIRENMIVPVEQVYMNDVKKIAFLTFDDGPSKNITPQILDVLDRYDVKATFFVLGKLCAGNSDIVHDIADRGHSIGIHTYSHDYGYIYSNTDNFVKEIKDTDTELKRILGEGFHTRLFRFPGGSFLDKAQPYKDALRDEGYVYIDWNSITGDGEASNISPEKLLERLEATAYGKQHLIVLMHDSATKQTTIQALPLVIDYLKAQGYEFAALR